MRHTVFPVTPRSVPWPRVVRRAALSVIAAAAVVAVLYLLLWYGPDVLARHDVGNVSGAPRVFRMQEARDAARGRLLTLGAGLFAAGALFYTARNFTLSRRQLLSTEQAQQRTLELTEQGQVTDRYTRAIEQLGSDKLDVRIGGIYALERIAHDSARDHPTVMEVLTAFVREHSRDQGSPPPTDVHSDDGPPKPWIRPDVQAAVTVIGRRDPRHDRKRVGLARANLPGAYLNSADLTSANLTGANLTRARLTDARIDDADLTDADLTDARLRGATLTGARLHQAVLKRAYLADADLTDAILTDAILADATLTGAHLNDSILAKADLTGADLTGAHLNNAHLNSADLAGADLTGANLSGAHLTKANLTEAHMPRTHLNRAHLQQRGPQWGLPQRCGSHRGRPHRRLP